MPELEKVSKEIENENMVKSSDEVSEVKFIMHIKPISISVNFRRTTILINLIMLRKKYLTFIENLSCYIICVISTQIVVISKYCKYR